MQLIIIINSIYNKEFKTAIVRTDISYLFPVIHTFKLKISVSSEKHQESKYLYKHIINESSHEYLNFDYGKLLDA